MKDKNIIITLIATLIVVISFLSFSNLFGNTFSSESIEKSINNLQEGEVLVFKSQYCGCCVGYVSELEKNHFNVKVKHLEELSLIKEKYNIPQSMQSCHTAIVNGYFIEGHVPVEAVNKMLSENPDIDGIALSGMPSGSPGMPGEKTEQWIIYGIKNREYSEFMVV